VDAVVPVQGKRGRPRRRPKALYGDRGYDSGPHRRETRRRKIKLYLARRGQPHGSGLAKVRWVVERTLGLVHQFRRLRVRYDRRADIHEAFFTLVLIIICWRFLKSS
jgi:transposase